jgi:haloalkane dehalogenase
MDRPAGVVDFEPVPRFFPFESRWFDSSVGPVHYVDEGAGRPVLMCHGNPDWSFLYRHVINGLRDSFRCVAVDYPGFGLSEHPQSYGYTPAEHAGVIGELVDHLNLTDAVVMGSDWGGPIGLDVASRRPERVAGLVMGNTWFWPAEAGMRVFSRALGSAPSQWLIVHRNAFVRPLMTSSIRRGLSALEVAHYLDVLPTPESRRGAAEFPRQIIGSGPWLEELEARVRANLPDKPTVLIFGRKDAGLGTRAISRRWQETFPHATLVELPDAGHYIQEDAPEEIVAAVRRAFG